MSTTIYLGFNEKLAELDPQWAAARAQEEEARRAEAEAAAAEEARRVEAERAAW